MPTRLLPYPIFVSAFFPNNTQILGNGQGQGNIWAIDYKRTKHYKRLVREQHRFTRVAYWTITKRGKIIETIKNTQCEGGWEY